jgi:hypothetical protein
MLETSYNRHISYCRRAHSRPRNRVKSCRACRTAKAKCSFQLPCLRCSNKGLECEYDTATITRRDEEKDSDELLAQANALVFSPSSMGADFMQNNLFVSSGQTDTDEAQVEIDWDGLDFTSADTHSQTPKSGLLHYNESTSRVLPNELFPSNPESRDIGHDLDGNFGPENLSATKLSWPDWNTRDEPFTTISRRYERPDSDILARLPILDSVSQFAATMVMQMLRAFPEMMLRRETLPYFIHGHWYRLSTAAELSLPEPLVNCMGIAQVFASHCHESKPFLWRTVKIEQRSLIEKVRSLVPLLWKVPNTKKKSYYLPHKTLPI